MIISFDDGHKSILEAEKVFDKYNAVGVLYVNGFSIGSPNSLSLRDIKRLYNKGWEIGSHTYTHAKLVNCDSIRIEKELVWNLEYFIKHGIDLKGFAYPWGEYNDQITGIVKRYHIYARATVGTKPSRYNEKYRLKACVVGGSKALDDIKNTENRFVTIHKLSNKPDVQTCKISDLEKLIVYYKENGIKIERACDVI